MSSKLASLARVVFSSKAAAARSAPAAFVGPLQKIFGGAHDDDEEEEHQPQDERDEQQQLQTVEEPSIFSALVARAGILARANATGMAPIDAPAARRELEDFRADYYRRAMEPPSEPEPDLSIPVGEDDYLYLAQ